MLKEKKITNLPFEGHGFNKEHIASFSSSDAFVKQATEFKDDPNRVAKLKEIWAIATGKTDVAEQPNQAAKQTDTKANTGTV